MTHDRERWAVLRRSVASGVIGGPDDGAGADADETALFEVSVSCDHGEVMFEVEIRMFRELLAGMNVLAYRHHEEFGCDCVAVDEAIARRAVNAWRDAFGRDPNVYGGGLT